MKQNTLRIKLNPDKELVREVQNKLIKTKGYCPCVNPIYYSSEYKCPCKEFRETTEIGECHCGLYVKVRK